MTLKEYNLHMKAEELAEVDRQYHLHLLAFQCMRAQGQKKSGKGTKPAFPRFKSFFDYDKILKGVEEKQDKRKKKQKESKYAGLIDYYRKGGK